MGLSKFKKGTAVAAVCLLLAATTACGSDGASSSAGNKTIKVVYSVNGSNDPAGQWLDKVKKQFEKKHHGVTVKIVSLKGSEGTYTSKKDLMLRSASTAPDVVVEDTYMVHPDSEAGYLTPLGNRVKKWDEWGHFIKTVKQGVKGANGKTYGVPYSTDTRGLWYDTKLFKKAGLPVPWRPKNWADVLKAAQTIKQKFPNVDPFWANSGKATGEATTMQTFEMLLYGTHNTLYDKKTHKWVVKSQGFLDSLKFINTIYNQNLGPKLSNVLTGQAATVEQQLMRKQKIAIALDGNWVPAVWRANGPNPWPQAANVYHIAPMPTQNGGAPGHTTMSGGWCLAIPSKSDRKDLAWDFIKLATSKKNTMFADIAMGNLTTRKDVQNDPYFQKKMGPSFQKAAEFLKFTHYRPTYNGYTNVSTAIQAAVESIATGTATPKQAMKSYAQAVKRSVGADHVESK